MGMNVKGREDSSRAWKCCTPVIPTLGRLKQEDFHFEATEQEFVSTIRETEGREGRERRREGPRGGSVEKNTCANLKISTHGKARHSHGLL